MSRITTSADFVTYNELSIVKRFNLNKALSYVTIAGKYLEFGVWNGNSINFIASKIQPTQIIYGFDSWQGLPEDWVTLNRVHPAGSYSTNGTLPNVAANVKLVSGWFESTLPQFVLEHPEPTAFVHIDSDLYSSAKTVFTHIGPSLVKGSVVVFDEWFATGCEDRAFKEFLEEANKTATAVFSTTRQMTFVID